MASSRRQIGILLTALAAAILLLVLAPDARGVEPKEPAGQGNDVSATTLSGVLNVRHGDPRPGSRAKPSTEYVLIDDRGDPTELLLDAGDAAGVGGPRALSGEQVEVVGARVPGDKIEVSSVQPAPTAARKPSTASARVTGSRPTVTIPCRFADSTGETPHPKSWYETLMGETKPGMDHYWREVSYGNINLGGGLVTDWVNLPQPMSYYLNDPNMLDLLAEDCAAAADAGVNFPSYTNINLVFNHNLNYSAYGGDMTLTRDGQTKTYGTTWMPRFALEPNQASGTGQVWLAHEMGHSYGLPHSSGPYAETYDSDWDPMSDGSVCSPMDATYGCVGVYTISHHMDLLGWVPPERKYVATTAPDQSLTLERIGVPNQNGAYLMARIPIAGSTSSFYTVEARRFAGYDSQVPGEGIVIHEVDATPTQDPNVPDARVVDPDNNGNPNDAGAMWLPGETFTDSANGISVKVTGQTASGYTVLINGTPTTTPPPPPPPPPPVNAAPVAAANTYSVKEDKLLRGTGVLRNDYDPNGDPISAQLVKRTTKGRLTFRADGTFTYKPKANFFGTDSFTYKAFDGQAYSNIVKVTIRVRSQPG